MFKAEPIRQAKAGSCWKRDGCCGGMWNCDPGYTHLFLACPAAQEIALVLFLQQTWCEGGLCWVSCCSRRIKCIVEGLPRVPWLLYSCHTTSVGACPHTGQQWRVQHLTITLAISQTKTIELTWVFWACKASHYGAAANLPLLRAFKMMQGLFQTTEKVSGSEYLKNIRGTE